MRGEQLAAEDAEPDAAGGVGEIAVVSCEDETLLITPSSVDCSGKVNCIERAE